MVIAALLIIAKKQNNPNVRKLTDEKIKCSLSWNGMYKGCTAL